MAVCTRQTADEINAITRHQLTDLIPSAIAFFRGKYCIAPIALPNIAHLGATPKHSTVEKFNAPQPAFVNPSFFDSNISKSDNATSELIVYGLLDPFLARMIRLLKISLQ